MFLLDGAVVTSPSDLTTLSKCEFAFARTLDARLGRLDAVPVDDDPMLKRAGRLGDAHESRRLEEYRSRHGAGVVEIARPQPLSAATLREAQEATVVALKSGAPVVFQATFFDETRPEAPTVGYADFLVLQTDGRYRVQDTKLARSVKVTALLQLAAYHAHLERLGIPVDDTVELLLGDGSVSSHAIGDIAPVYRRRRQRLDAVVAHRLAATGATQWREAEYAIDGDCVHCAEQVAAADDLVLVAGLRLDQRAKLLDVGIRTVDDLGSRPEPPEGCAVPAATYAALHRQAALQLEARRTGTLPYEVRDSAAIAALPAPDPGDLFFDFEGDPLWRGDLAGRVVWGLDYLFGVVDDGERFRAYWAHDLEAEKTALLDFLDLVREQRQKHPGMHIYHYAPYERTHLLSIAARHGVGEHEVDELLRQNVLVDLYPVVRRGIRVGSPSYSIKKLEPLYMGDELRSDDGVTTAVGSVEEYEQAMDARAAGDDLDAQQRLDAIADYNRYDCVSTRRLRNWLLERIGGVGTPPDQSEPNLPDKPFEESDLAVDLRRLAGTADEAAERDAYLLAAAAVDYHRREQKAFWWQHFARLEYPLDEWRDDRGVFVVEHGEVLRDWHLDEGTRQQRPRRHIRLVGEWAAGTGTPGVDAFALYEPPTPYVKPGRGSAMRLDNAVTIVSADGGEEVIIEETRPPQSEPWIELPVALAPGAPPHTGNIDAAIAGFGERLRAGAPLWPDSAASRILRRRPPHDPPTQPHPLSPPDRIVEATVASLLELPDSYLAVQGPPGTGKTHVAGHVIRALVEHHGWRVGVTAQSHKVVENVLDSVVKAGLDPALVGKAAPRGQAGSYAERDFAEIPSNGQAHFAAAHRDTGYVIGGTAWDLTNPNRFDERQLDLLVIDEAGQFSLAPTIAVASAAQRLLLLGDPQQLPQVSQGIHPAPVDTSALGHIGDGHDVLPAEFGYFLAESRRMDAALTRPVSHLSYDDALQSHPVTRGRSLHGVPPGLHPVPVEHAGDTTSSLDEAQQVVALVRRHLGRGWLDPGLSAERRPLSEDDVIVVTPYNAQVQLIEETLAAAGHGGVRVGTVDKFQGQEAVVAIVSLAASSAVEVPRGIGFLLSRNRLNVAVSRAQWAAYLVHSPQLADHLPRTPEGVAELSRFIELVEPTA